MSLQGWKVSALLTGRTGMGVGRDEASEIARRYTAATGENYQRYKNDCEWFLVRADAFFEDWIVGRTIKGGTPMIPITAVPNYLFSLEIGRPISLPEPTAFAREVQP